MNKEQIFAAWAPDDSLWSTWVKPVLFAHLDDLQLRPDPLVPTPEPARRPVNLDWCPPVAEKVALIVDLPGPEGVVLGALLAERGYRPVPLYNALPLPNSLPFGRHEAVVNVLPTLDALRREAERLAGLTLPPDAPPVFLLDAHRQGAVLPDPEMFDNRSVCFTTDFPSANFLHAHGFKRALLVPSAGLEAAPDLSHLLRRWQEGGIALQILRSENARPEVLVVPRPSWYGAMFQRALSAFGLHRASGGGFGAWMTSASG